MYRELNDEELPVVARRSIAQSTNFVAFFFSFPPNKRSLPEMHSLVLRGASRLAAKPISSVRSPRRPARRRPRRTELDLCSFRRCRLSRAPTPPQSQVNAENWFYFVPSLIPILSAAAAEVSSILESRIAGTSLGGDVQETGRVLSEHTSCKLFKQCFLIIFQRLVTVSRVFMVSPYFTRPRRSLSLICSSSTPIGLRNVQGTSTFTYHILSCSHFSFSW